MPDFVVTVLVLVTGLVVGSFLNVCIHRLPRRESIAFPASHCPACGRSLAWFENVPVLAYVALGGRCRSCRAVIGLRYPLVELTTGALFVVHYSQLGLEPLLVPRLVLASAMVALFAIDLEHQLLPNAITLPGIVAGFVFSLFLPPGWSSSLLGILLGGAIPWAIAEAWFRVRQEEAMGGGDIKMLAMIGAFLGWPLMLLTLVLASFLGSIVGLAVIAWGRGTMKSLLPFGTFLAIATVVSSLYGEAILSWYISHYWG